MTAAKIFFGFLALLTPVTLHAVAEHDGPQARQEAIEQHLAQADVPTPAPPAPTPAPVDPPAPLSIDIVTPDVMKPGTFIPLTLATNAKLVNVAWLVNRLEDPSHILPGANNKHVTFTGTEGVYEISVVGTFNNAPKYYAETITVGDPVPPQPPEPDKPLIQLVTTEQAPALAAFYRTVIQTADKLTKPADFWGVHDSRMGVLGLAKSEYERVVSKRFEPFCGRSGEPFDVVKLVGELANVVVQLSGPAPEPPPRPTPPPVTATKLWIIAIDDAPTRTPQQTLLLSDVSYWSTVKAKGHDYEWYQTGSSDAEKFSAFIKFPDELVLQDATTGKVLGVEELPQQPTKAWADGVVAKYSGVK